MKLRLRLIKFTKVLEVCDDEVSNLTVGDVAERVQDIFGDAVFGEFELSLNNKDCLCRDLKIVGDCDVVSGDLIFVLPQGDFTPPQQLQEATASQPQSSDVTQQKDSEKANQELSESEKSFHINDTGGVSNIGSVDTEKPGTSADMHAEQQGASNEVAMETEEEPVDLIAVQKCLSEPVLCREATDGRVPALLRELHTALEPGDVPETLCVVLHVLMLETGFTLHQEACSGPASCPVPAEWRCSGYYKFTYMYPGCGETTSCLTVIPTGSSANIHGKVIGSDDSNRQCQLKPAEYVQRVHTDSAQCYCQLAKLSRVFKDSVASPLVHDIRTAAGLEDIFGLLALTQEVKLRILSFLDVKSLLQLCLVNKELYELGKDPYLWRNLYLQHFGNRKDNSLSQDWKELYKKEYKARKERRKAMSRMKILHPPNWGPQNPFSGPSNWIPVVPGGIIGGDYDLYPNFPGSLPGAPGRLGPLPPNLPRPRYDLIGPGPGVDPGPDPGLLPWRPGGRMGGRGGGGQGFAGFGPRFF